MKHEPRDDFDSDAFAVHSTAKEVLTECLKQGGKYDHMYDEVQLISLPN